MTKIEWTDFTLNWWEGCQKVGPGCDNCYAEARDIRFTGGTHWGPGAPRRKVKGAAAKLRRIRRGAEAFRAQHGRAPRIFCFSLADVFDKAVDPAWRAEAFAEMEAATECRFQLLTKRVGNVAKMIPEAWGTGDWPAHIGLMITVVNQEEANRDVPKLLDLKAKLGIPWVGLSCEPLLGPVDLRAIESVRGELRPYRARIDALDGTCQSLEHRSDDWFKLPTNLDWVIVGGESGPGARPMHPDWARSLRDQCVAAGTALFFKQWGKWLPVYDHDEDPDWRLCDSIARGTPNGRWMNLKGGHGFHGDRVVRMYRVDKARAGRLLDGREWNDLPEGAA